MLVMVFEKDQASAYIGPTELGVVGPLPHRDTPVWRCSLKKRLAQLIRRQTTRHGPLRVPEQFIAAGR
jgi:hypothetical protein